MGSGGERVRKLGFLDVFGLDSGLSCFAGNHDNTLFQLLAGGGVFSLRSPPSPTGCAGPPACAPVRTQRSPGATRLHVRLRIGRRGLLGCPGSPMQTAGRVDGGRLRDTVDHGFVLLQVSGQVSGFGGFCQAIVESCGDQICCNSSGRYVQQLVLGDT